MKYVVSLFFLGLSLTVSASETFKVLPGSSGLGKISRDDVVAESTAYLDYLDSILNQGPLSTENARAWLEFRRRLTQTTPLLLGAPGLPYRSIFQPVALLATAVGIFQAVDPGSTIDGRIRNALAVLGLHTVALPLLSAGAQLGPMMNGRREVQHFVEGTLRTGSELKASLTTYDAFRVAVDTIYGAANVHNEPRYTELVHYQLIRFAKKYPIIFTGWMIRFFHHWPREASDEPRWVRTMIYDMQARPQFWIKHVREAIRVLEKEPTAHTPELLASGRSIEVSMGEESASPALSLGIRIHAVCQAALQWTVTWGRKTPF